MVLFAAEIETEVEGSADIELEVIEAGAGLGAGTLATSFFFSGLSSDIWLSSAQSPRAPMSTR